MIKDKNWIQDTNGKWLEYKGDVKFLRWSKEEPYWKLYIDPKPPTWIKGPDGFYIQIKTL
jgi:hypothetical protein